MIHVLSRIENLGVIDSVTPQDRYLCNRSKLCEYANQIIVYMYLH